MKYFALSTLLILSLLPTISLADVCPKFDSNYNCVSEGTMKLLTPRTVKEEANLAQKHGLTLDLIVQLLKKGTKLTVIREISKDPNSKLDFTNYLIDGAEHKAKQGVNTTTFASGKCTSDEIVIQERVVIFANESKRTVTFKEIDDGIVNITTKALNHSSKLLCYDPLFFKI
jgi:hypothetical protein